MLFEFSMENIEWCQKLRTTTCIQRELAGASRQQIYVLNWSEKTFHKLSKQINKWCLKSKKEQFHVVRSWWGRWPNSKLSPIFTPRRLMQTTKYFSSRCIPIASTGLTCNWLDSSVFSCAKSQWVDEERGLPHELNPRSPSKLRSPGRNKNCFQCLQTPQEH